jgi:hypothetical protein
MENRLTEVQLTQLVGEVERLSQRRNAEYDREQVKEILQELNLPTDLLDDAMVQLQRREALAAQKQRNRRIMGGVAVVLVGAIAIYSLFAHNQSKVRDAIANVSITSSVVSLTQTGSSPIKAISGAANQRIYYRVTLQNVPIGEKLSLSCNWIDPRGNVVHQSRYQTQQIDKSVWPTYCYHQLNSTSATGTWKVEMALAGRKIAGARFDVK